MSCSVNYKSNGSAFIEFYCFTGRSSHIVQMAAVAPWGTYDVYVSPKVSIQEKASKVTGIRMRGGKMYFEGKPVTSIGVKQALEQFVNFLGGRRVILVGHNIKVFDCPILLNALVSCGFETQFEKAVVGFLDTYPLFKGVHKGLTSYRQEHLYTHFIGGQYEAHNALADVQALDRLISSTIKDQDIVKPYTFSVQYITDVQEFIHGQQQNLVSWQPAIIGNFISKGMAEKAAGSGLRLEHLKFMYGRNKLEGLKSLFSETSSGKPRVTKSKKIIDKMGEFFVEKTSIVPR